MLERDRARLAMTLELLLVHRRFTGEISTTLRKRINHDVLFTRLTIGNRWCQFSSDQSVTPPICINEWQHA